MGFAASCYLLGINYTIDFKSINQSSAIIDFHKQTLKAKNNAKLISIVLFAKRIIVIVLRLECTRQNIIIMIQNAHKKTSPIKNLFTERHSMNDERDYQEDDQYQHERYNQISFMKRFKNNQQTLRNKFRNYVDRQKYIFPHTYQKFSHSDFSEAEEQSDIRKIRREKEQLIQEMNRSQNQTSYYLHKNQQHQKACDILQEKWRKVQSIRRERKSQVKKLEVSLKAIKQQIKSQKLSFFKKISSQKHNITKSRIECTQRKLSQAKDARVQKQLHRSKISQERFQSINQNKMKCKTVRESEQKVTFYVERVRQEKKEQAKELKLTKLFRQLAERQEAKIDSAKIKRKSKRKIEHFKINTLTLEEKIKQFRKSLAQRRLDPISKIKLCKYQKNRSFTQSNQITAHSQLFEINRFNTSQSPFELQ